MVARMMACVLLMPFSFTVVGCGDRGELDRAETMIQTLTLRAENEKSRADRMARQYDELRQVADDILDSLRECSHTRDRLRETLDSLQQRHDALNEQVQPLRSCVRSLVNNKRYLRATFDAYDEEVLQQLRALGRRARTSTTDQTLDDIKVVTDWVIARQKHLSEQWAERDKAINDEYSDVFRQVNVFRY